MGLAVPCPVCYAPANWVFHEVDFKPSREQVQGWVELGARLIPKIERVHHQFEKTEIVFESGGQD